ncbi:MAG: hypothetical protein M3Q47_15215 [Actinomycetota bacterium]|nr:hypothetical protein [Actinomycetota bacterium]
MSDEQADEPKEPTPARDWTTRRPRRSSLGASYLASPAVANAVRQLNAVTRSPIHDVVREVQRSVFPAIQLPQTRMLDDLSKAVMPTTSLAAVTPAVSIVEAWQPRMAEIVGSSQLRIAQQFTSAVEPLLNTIN